jgi:nitric oxide synthase-interacting protein
MSRHSKNCNSSATFTYAERQKVTDYGTQKQRLGVDSQKKFGLCSIYLHELNEPMCCERGHVFCRDCGLTHIMRQKESYKNSLV